LAAAALAAAALASFCLALAAAAAAAVGGCEQEEEGCEGVVDALGSFSCVVNVPVAAPVQSACRAVALVN
jgi:hypothetical protein